MGLIMRRLEVAGRWKEQQGRNFTGGAGAAGCNRPKAKSLVLCGLMDQLSFLAWGVRGALLPILCHPDILDEAGIAAAGCRHRQLARRAARSGFQPPYAAGASFMGKKRYQAVLGRKLAHVTQVLTTITRHGREATLPRRFKRC